MSPVSRCRSRPETARASRRLGLGITGLADALIMLGLRYDSEAARRVAADAMRSVTEAAYWASVEIARDKGAFPLFDRDRYLGGALRAVRCRPNCRRR